MYLEVSFNDPNKKVENLYIYKEILKTSEVIQTTTYTTIDGYRYGFNNMEKDDQIKGRGNSYTTFYRMLDPRLGRFFAVDPLAKEFPWNSVYAFSENRLLDCIELEGKEAYWVHGTKKAWGNDWSNKVHSAQMQWKDLVRIGKVFGNKRFDRGFNWNGANNDKARQAAAVNLANHVMETRKKLIEEGKIADDEPITLIGHSHGGNVSIAAANILIEKHQIKPEQINIVAINTPREHDINLFHTDVNLYSINANGDKVQRFGSDGSVKAGSKNGPIYVLGADLNIFYEDSFKKDYLVKMKLGSRTEGYQQIGIEGNHSGFHEKNINVWLPKLKEALKVK